MFSWFPFHVLMLFCLFCDQRKPSVVFLINFCFQNCLWYFCLDAVVNNNIKKTQRNTIYIEKLTNLLGVRPTSCSKYWYYSTSRCLDFKRQYPTLHCLSQKGIPHPDNCLTLNVQVWFTLWIKVVKMSHRENLTVSTLNLTAAAAAVFCVGYVLPILWNYILSII